MRAEYPIIIFHTEAFIGPRGEILIEFRLTNRRRLHQLYLTKAEVSKLSAAQADAADKKIW